MGLFLSHGQAQGGIVANSLAKVQVHTGTLTLMSEGVGVYWTYLDSDGWYLDLVGMANWLHGGATSDRGIGNNVSGYSLLGSAELGMPMPLDETWTLEPQAQFIVQNVALGNATEPFTSIDYANLTGVTGRFGVRLEADTDISGHPTQVFASADIWHRYSSESTVRFNDDVVHTTTGGISLELEAGFNTAVTEAFSAFGALSYETAIDGRPNAGFGANAGFKVTW